MPAAANLKLAPHFTARELGADDPAATDGIVRNLTSVAAWLEAARAIIGAPLTVTSGYRTAAHNAAIGGSPTTDHIKGLAADFVAVGPTPFEVYTRLTQARGQLPAFDQLIFYQTDDHVHVGLGLHPAMRSQQLLAAKEAGATTYEPLTATAAERLRGFV